MKIAAQCWLRAALVSVVAISLAFRHTLASEAESEVAYLSLGAETLVPVGRSEIWKMSCREKLTASEEDFLSDLVGGALPGDGPTFNEYKVRIGLLLGKERYYSTGSSGPLTADGDA
jgi:hypothetical protein